MKTSKLTIKDSSIAFVFGFLLCQTVVVAVTIVLMLLLKIFNSSLDSAVFLETGLGYLILSSTLYLTMFILFFFLNKGKDNKITEKISIKKLLLYIAIALLTFICLYPVVTCVDTLLVKCGIGLSTLSYPLTTKNYFISLISLVIAPAVCEELLFRGIILNGLKKHGKTFSILTTALMFCLFHMSINQTVYPLLMGLLLSVIMYYEGNIYYCIAIHLTNNFLSLTLSYFKINLIFNHFTYIILAIALAALFIGLVLYFTIRNSKNYPHEKLNKTEKIFLFSSLGFMITLWLLINII